MRSGPRTLCEVAEVVDENWREAAESLLGRDRETVIVDPDHAYRATEILRRGRSDYPGCRVANTRKLQSRSNSPERGTLASIIHSDDPLVMAFVVFRVGNVRLAGNQGELLSGGRAVMADGAYHDGLVTEVLRAQGVKIGRAAAPLMIAVLQQRITEHGGLLQVHREKERLFDDVLRRLEQCAQPVEDKDRLEVITSAYSDLAERRAETRQRQSRIASQIAPQLMEAEARATRIIKSLNEDRNDLVDRRASLKADLRQVEQTLAGGNTQAGSWLCLNDQRRDFRKDVHSVLHFQIDEASLAWSRKSSYMGTMPGEGTTLGQVLRLAGAVSERLGEVSASEMDFRSFSRLAAGDSKALENNLSSVASAIPRLFALNETQAALNAEELLAVGGIKRLPQPVLICGAISLDDLPFPKMPFIGVPAECAGCVNLDRQPTYVMTIENFSSFVRYVREVAQGDNALVIYTGGFPSRPMLEAIVNLTRQACAPVYHWGDMDGGGVRIFRYIEQRLASVGANLQPHMMDSDLLRKVGSKAQFASALA